LWLNCCYEPEQEFPEDDGIWQSTSNAASYTFCHSDDTSPYTGILAAKNQQPIEDNSKPLKDTDITCVNMYYRSAARSITPYTT